MSTISHLKVGQFRAALKTEKPVLLVKANQDKIRMEHYVPLCPQVLLTFKEPHNFIAAVTYGLGGIGNRSAYSFVPEIEAELASESRISVEEFSKKLSSFFMNQWNKIPELKDYKGAPMT
jgi:hypothetical protein